MKCRICNCEGDHPIFRVKEMMFGTREEFDYFKCSSCGCLQITDIPNDLSRFYPDDDYYSFNTPCEKSDSNKLNSFLQKLRCKAAILGKGLTISRFLSPFVDFPYELHEYGPMIKQAKLNSFDDGFLDVGCGNNSWWLNSVRKLGFNNLIGVDPFIKKDVSYNGITIYKKSIAEVNQQFSIITFHHSFEHIVDQHGTMREIKRLLTPGGVCLIRIPIVSSYAWEKYGVNWVELDAPRHLYLHTNKSIEKLAKTVGLRLINTIYDSEAFEFIGSEQYLMDIPLFSENSYVVNPYNSEFTYKQIGNFIKEAERVSKEKVGGRAGFYFASR
jgi:SAM-dependent methyltransferase